MIDIRKSIPPSNYGQGRSHVVDTIVFHHIVGDAGSAIARFRQPGVQVSSTYIIGSDGKVYYVVSESNTPYTNGNYAENTRSITIEHAGGGGVPYTEAMYKASEALCREIRKRHKITRFLRHKDIVATACPGGLNVERIVKNSKPVTAPAPKPVPKENKMTRAEATAIVTSLYTNLLGRKPDKPGLENYVGHLLKGNYGFPAQDMARSEEFKRRNIRTVQKVVEKPKPYTPAGVIDFLKSKLGVK